MSKDNKKYYIAYLLENQFGGLTPIDIIRKKDREEAIKVWEDEKCSNETKQGFLSKVIEVYIENGIEKFDVIRN
ncbi:hypothetical protein BFS06_12390 [Clostridium perfringens]|uniref:Phage protein n=1 Tax=Clostridium perfringens TaxID=1502 RepID=A0A140GR45_CLOPF|nr:hypothetical protein [Clostridium perfringens]AMN31004.1 hypothetical protein JFP838_pA0088 [Clostridium perfringens]TBX15000.1 hypothetical protein BFS06_12390 [Clostridium perfringens]